MEKCNRSLEEKAAVNNIRSGVVIKRFQNLLSYYSTDYTVLLLWKEDKKLQSAVSCSMAYQRVTSHAVCCWRLVMAFCRCAITARHVCV
ncbi:hypothetical protein T10_6822 [Trichinella papuae]|uniref:Uncharacterized protein n=1 Tax=Trichinella papuae TaxID=268474 RepID=A0A0V1MB10_9BILA|nr:hypothetical protein T10_6822 [Trichinella papuae]